MLFDLTKNIELEPDWQKRYLIARWILGLVFLGGVIYLGLAILFPSQSFIYPISGPTGTQNALENVAQSGAAQTFDAFSPENFSTAQIRISLSKNLPSGQNPEITIRKTYKAFSYPTATEPVSTPAANPENGGFSNGTLLSFGDSIFAVVDGKAMPFDNPITFLSLGYQWKDVIPATEAEIGLYQRDKLFSIDRPHPNGTVFLTLDSHKYFLVQNGQKMEITDAGILKTYLHSSPIAVDEKSLNFKLSCGLQKDIWPLHSYSCSIPISDLAQFLGNNYQFSIQNIGSNNIQHISLSFSRNPDWSNARNTLSDIKHKFLLNYGYEAPK